MPRGGHMRVRWSAYPSTVFGGELRKRFLALQPALVALAAYHSLRAEAAMKSRAGWNDRTAYARSSLFARAQGMMIILGTTNAEYGHFLELGTSRMQAFPTIRPQLEETSVEYYRDAIQLIRSTLFR